MTSRVLYRAHRGLISQVETPVWDKVFLKDSPAGYLELWQLRAGLSQNFSCLSFSCRFSTVIIYPCDISAYLLYKSPMIINPSDRMTSSAGGSPACFWKPRPCSWCVLGLCWPIKDNAVSSWLIDGRTSVGRRTVVSLSFKQQNMSQLLDEIPSHFPDTCDVFGTTQSRHLFMEVHLSISMDHQLISSYRTMCYACLF